ncbi:CD48 antigen-like isoform X2 [Xyrichtys novacula]|uniref:CD48 antigen-like isoform X2 n=1 Tax=Xyrichtys novacula TaxID=13765 RepID=A0AAV1GH97_XYRNO|nr:CD48 antigen-like isoform X2 [Xyrichtys novacula]
MMSIFVILGLLVYVEAKGTPVFVQTGEDLLLDLQTPVTLGKDDEISWIVNNTENIARFPDFGPLIFSSYTGRAEFFTQNLSLLLKNVTKSDNGRYRACFSGETFIVAAEYSVRVLDPVSPVSLTVNSCSSDSSNLTVTCSTQDSLIRATFTCDKQTCSEERGDREEFTTPGTSLRVYLEDGAIICNHSNQASRTEDIKKLEDFCTPHAGPTTSYTGVSVCRVKVIVISSGLIIMVCAVISVHVIERVGKRR